MRRPTRGFTLIEVVMAMLMLGTLLTVVAMVLGKLARVDSQSRDRIDQQRVARRLVGQLRQDAHHAIACTISTATVEPVDGDAGADSAAPRQTLTLSGSDGRTIQFQTTEHGLARIVTHDDLPEHRESFEWRVPPSATWTKDTTHESPMAVLTLTFAGGLDRAPRRHVVRATLMNVPSEQVPSKPAE